MTTKRTRGRVGPFEREHMKIDYAQRELGDRDALRELIEANSPQGRVSNFRRHADRLKVARELLDEAEALIDEKGSVKNFDRFEALMWEVELKIERAQNEHLNVYGLAGDRARQSAKTARNNIDRAAEKRAKAKKLNKRLIAWDNELAQQNPKHSQEQRAAKIQKLHASKLPRSVANSKSASLAKRIRSARKTIKP